MDKILIDKNMFSENLPIVPGENDLPAYKASVKKLCSDFSKDITAVES